jgi:hypothetical protein
MTTALALQCNPHEVALQTAEGKILVEHEGQLHQTYSSNHAGWVTPMSWLTQPMDCQQA